MSWAFTLWHLPAISLGEFVYIHNRIVISCDESEAREYVTIGRHPFRYYREILTFGTCSESSVELHFGNIDPCESGMLLSRTNFDVAQTPAHHADGPGMKISSSMTTIK